MHYVRLQRTNSSIRFCRLKACRCVNYISHSRDLDTMTWVSFRSIIYLGAVPAQCEVQHLKAPQHGVWNRFSKNSPAPSKGTSATQRPVACKHVHVLDPVAMLRALHSCRRTKLVGVSLPIEAAHDALLLTMKSLALTELKMCPLETRHSGPFLVLVFQDTIPYQTPD